MTEPTNQQQRDRIAAKVKALLSKTVERGCAEDEALAAAAAAARLMQDYDLTYTDLEAEVQADRYGVRRVLVSSNPLIERIALPVADYCGCKIWKQGDTLCLFGSQHDTDMASQTMAMLAMAMASEWQRYLNGPSRPDHIHGRTLRASFLAGMARRLSERLREMRQQRNAATTGTALVVVKDQIVTSKFRDYCRATGLRLGGGGRSTRTVGSSSAYAAGQAAGGRVDLGGRAKVGGGGNARLR